MPDVPCLFSRVFDGLIDAIVFLNVLVHTRVAFVEKGILQRSPMIIQRRYWALPETWMQIIACFPLNLFCQAPAWKLNRLIHTLYFIKRFNQILDDHLPARYFLPNLYFDWWYILNWHWYKFHVKLSSSLNVLYRLIKLINLLLGFLLLTHWTGCIYFSFAFFEGFGTNTWLPSSDFETASAWKRFSRSLFFSFKVLTRVGPMTKPATNAERIFTICMAMFGLFVIADLISNVGSLIVNLVMLILCHYIHKAKIFQRICTNLSSSRTSIIWTSIWAITKYRFLPRKRWLLTEFFYHFYY